MSNNELKWATKQRFRFVENLAYWLGCLNRGDLTSRFGISVPQASKDLTQYQSLYPDNIRYDHRAKQYFASENFKPNFIDNEPHALLQSILNSSLDWTEKAGVWAEAVPAPTRNISNEILRDIVRTISTSQSVEILYQSMNPNKPDTQWRRITPHSFATDGMRWHVRSYCHVDQKFKDFLLSRCKETRDQGLSGESIRTDKFWNEYLDVKLKPNSELSQSQKGIIADEYGMEDNFQTVPVRKAMLYYFEKRLRLDVANDRDHANEAPVVIANRDEFDRCLKEAMA